MHKSIFYLVCVFIMFFNVLVGYSQDENVDIKAVPSDVLKPTIDEVGVSYTEVLNIFNDIVACDKEKQVSCYLMSNSDKTAYLNYFSELVSEKEVNREVASSRIDNAQKDAQKYFLQLSGLDNSNILNYKTVYGDSQKNVENIILSIGTIINDEEKILEIVLYKINPSSQYLVLTVFEAK